LHIKRQTTMPTLTPFALLFYGSLLNTILFLFISPFFSSISVQWGGYVGWFLGVSCGLVFTSEVMNSFPVARIKRCIKDKGYKHIFLLLYDFFMNFKALSVVIIINIIMLIVGSAVSTGPVVGGGIFGWCLGVWIGASNNFHIDQSSLASVHPNIDTQDNQNMPQIEHSPIIPIDPINLSTLDGGQIDVPVPPLIPPVNHQTSPKIP